MDKRAEIVAAARAMVGTRWEHRGRVPGLALDCGGVLICAARRTGCVAPDFDVPEYTMDPNGKLVQWCEQHLGARVPQRLLIAGQVVIMIVDKEPQHVGITANWKDGGLSIIHASNARSTNPPRVLESRLMWHRAQRFVAAFEFPGVA